MAGRATPPASCLASAQPSVSSRPRQRPRFARIPSASRSTYASVSAAQAARSDESLTTTLNSLGLDDGTKYLDSPSSTGIDSGAGSDVGSPARPALGRPASPNRQSYLQETPGRRGSKPINIAAPKHQPAVYTPLSARGDLPGGYFPNHESLSRQYKTHPFFKKPDPVLASPKMSNLSSAISSPSAAPRLAQQSMTSPGSSNIPSPEALAIPMGKYHPSNYKPVSSSGTTGLSSSPTSMPPNELQIPSSGKTNKRPAYERRTSDVKRKLQQYQRDMIAEARLAGLPSNQEQACIMKPTSPKLRPRGSPGPITPLELEESAGYMVAGMGEGDRERQREIVERMIEQERNMKGSGSGSPVLRV